MSAITDYLTEIQAEFKTGMAGEHAYRPALKKLLESAGYRGRRHSRARRRDRRPRSLLQARVL